ncbi:MAG: AI-2E family transporter [Actinomycetota bacterium]|nr:AI-2E family transporter [Actinomycetota bacterium]
MSPGYSRPTAGERLRRAGVAAWSIIGILVLSAIFIWAFLKVRIVFPPLVLATLILFVLNPLVTRLERWRVPRAAAALGSYVVVLGGLALAILALIPVLTHQVQQLSDELPEFRDQAIAFANDNVVRLEDTLNTQIDTTQITCLLGSPGDSLTEVPSQARCDEVTEDLRNQIVAQAGRITDIGSSIIEVLVIFVIGPLIALYLLIDLPHLSRDLKNLVPPSHRDEFVDLGGKVSHAIGGFFRGQLLVALIVGVLSALGFYFIGLPFWFVIGGIAGFFNLVPLIGPYIGGALGFLVGIVSGGLSLGLKAAVVELIVQQLDNHFISPNVMRRTVNLHPVTVILALLAGGALAGFWGVLLGVPAVAVIKVLLSHVWSTRVLGAEVTPHSSRRGETSTAPPKEGPSARDGPGSRQEELPRTGH